ncbi:hypothetical protein STEG23_034884, partial [Scotinomys teguina]
FNPDIELQIFYLIRPFKIHVTLSQWINLQNTGFFSLHSHVNCRTFEVISSDMDLPVIINAEKSSNTETMILRFSQNHIAMNDAASDTRLLQPLPGAFLSLYPH